MLLSPLLQRNHIFQRTQSPCGSTTLVRACHAVLRKIKPGTSPLSVYSEFVEKSVLREVHAQREVVLQLDRVFHDVVQMEDPTRKAPTTPSLFSRLFGSTAQPTPSPKGLYVYGGVGCGKTFVMDLFFQCLPEHTRKRRSHFHAFMLEVHDRLHELRKRGERALVTQVANDIVNENGAVFCFDEFNVTDIADAVILRELFGTMWRRGAVLVTTSNRAPKELYKNGIQRQLFVPCIEMIQERCVVHEMSASEDLRLLTTTDKMPTYILLPPTKANASTQQEKEDAAAAVLEADKQLDLLFKNLAKSADPYPTELVTHGRNIAIAKSAYGVADMQFEELCGQPTGAGDFLMIARAFHTLVLRNIPLLTPDKLPETRRFITLIDVLYEHKVKLICSAQAPPVKLLHHPEGASVQDELFAFHRTASRLIEMQSKEFKSQPHSPPIVGEDDFFEQIRVGELTNMELLWERYDKDRNGRIDISELRSLLEDLSEIKAGHRDVPDVIVHHAFKILAGDDKTNTKATGISKESFNKYFATASKTVWYL